MAGHNGANDSKEMLEEEKEDVIHLSGKMIEVPLEQKKEPEIELGKPMTKEQEERGHSAMAAGQLEEDAKVSTIDRLLAAAPETIDDHTLHNLRQSYNAALKRAENCEISEMVGNLLLFGQTADEIVDEMAWALRKDILQSADYDTYVRLLGLFQRRTVPQAIKKILLEECKCGVNGGGQ